ncbi:MAG: cell envelope integrity protein CreD [Pseudomonadota bacterium]
MQKKLFFKVLIITALMLLIGIALMMIQSTIRERMAFRDEAARSIANDSVGEQTVIGPVLVIPYIDEFETREIAKEGGKTVVTAHTVRRTHLVFPNDLRIKGAIGIERRYRGIHQVLVYNGRHEFTGDFTLPSFSELARDSAASRITFERPYLALPVADVRGIRDIPKINWDGREIEFEQGAELRAHKSGMHAQLEVADLRQGARAAFSFTLGLSGIERQHFVPVGKNNLVSVTSPWPHPQFGGRFLPEQRTITGDGFAAAWRISALATGAQQQLAQQERGEAPAGALDTFSVGFIEPVNIYSQADRATKYGLLFVALTFAAFFVFEILKRLAIHPVQYLLVGLALAMFFLLLVGLSEHIDFLISYLIASAACIVLTGFYLAHVLGQRRRGIGFGVVLTLLYGALYGLLSSENNALLLGSLLLFAVLAALMVATREVDWYRLGGPVGDVADSGPAPTTA